AVNFALVELPPGGAVAEAAEVAELLFVTPALLESGGEPIHWPMRSFSLGDFPEHENGCARSEIISKNTD
ncbi:MAG: hypothetical protein Q9157_000910, partial [Trypethelium eluteriae]